MKPRISNPIPFSPSTKTISPECCCPEPLRQPLSCAFLISQLQRLCCFSASLPLSAKSQDLDFENVPFKKKIRSLKLSKNRRSLVRMAVIGKTKLVKSSDDSDKPPCLRSVTREHFLFFCQTAGNALVFFFSFSY